MLQTDTPAGVPFAGVLFLSPISNWVKVIFLSDVSC